MKKLLGLVLFLLLAGLCVFALADVEINETNFPDANFRKFVTNIDADGNGILDSEEIRIVDTIFVPDMNIASLQGIEFFPNITYLACNGNQITSVDVSRNEQLTYISVGNNLLTSLDTSKNLALEKLTLENNQVTSLDLSSNTKLNYIQCYNNRISRLDVSHCPELDSLTRDCEQQAGYTWYGWEERNERGITLRQLYLDRKTRLFTTAGEVLPLFAGAIIDEATFPDANFRQYVWQFDKDYDGRLSKEELEAVEEINIEGGSVADLTGIEYFTHLTSLNCKWNPITSLDVSSNTMLVYLDCTADELTSLDVSHNPALVTLWCSENKLASLNLSKNTALQQLGCAHNLLTGLNISKNTSLKELYCDDNSFEKLTVTSSAVLSGLVRKTTRTGTEYGYDTWEDEGSALYVSSDMIVTAGKTVSKPVALTSVKFSKKQASAGQEVTITAKTSYNATKLAMYSGTEALESWTDGYTDKSGVRTWKVKYAFADSGNKALAFKAINGVEAISGPVNAEIVITKAPKIASVKFAKSKITVKQNVSIAVKTSTTVSKLTMYSGTKALKSWTTGYTDSGSTRTWKVTYAFSGAGNRTITFKAADANGALTAAKTATITIAEPGK